MSDSYKRTQDFNEYKQPIIMRTTALTQTLDMIKLFELKPSIVEFFEIQTQMFEYLENGQTKVFRTLHDKSKGKSITKEEK